MQIKINCNHSKLVYFSLQYEDIESKGGEVDSFEWDWRWNSLTNQFKDYNPITFQFSDYNSIKDYIMKWIIWIIG